MAAASSAVPASSRSASRGRSTAELLTAARAAGETAARYAAKGDAEGRLDDRVVEALGAIGFGRRLVAERWGGEPVGYGELTRAVAAVGEGCASAAWIGSLWAYTARFAVYLPERAQAEIWARGPDTRLASSLVPTGSVREVEGGWVLSGSWPYASGIEFSEWALVAGPGGVAPGRVRVFAVPRRDYGCVDSWYGVGMRATASHTLVVEDRFVPTHRSFLLADMRMGRNAVLASPYQCVPVRAVCGLTFGAPILGAARGVLRAAEEAAGGGASAPLTDAHRIELARAAAEIDTAQLILERVAENAERRPITSWAVERGQRDSALAAELLVAAVDRLFRTGGTSATADTLALQRIWRDVHTASSHVALRFDAAALRYTQHLRDAAEEPRA